MDLTIVTYCSEDLESFCASDLPDKTGTIHLTCRGKIDADLWGKLWKLIATTPSLTKVFFEYRSAATAPEGFDVTLYRELSTKKTDITVRSAMLKTREGDSTVEIRARGNVLKECLVGLSQLSFPEIRQFRTIDYEVPAELREALTTAFDSDIEWINVDYVKRIKREPRV